MILMLDFQSGGLNIKQQLQAHNLNLFVLDCKKANVESIKKSIESVNWEVMFINKSFHKQVSIFIVTLMNISSNFPPDKLVTFGDRDLPWMNDYVNGKIKWKNQLYKT